MQKYKHRVMRREKDGKWIIQRGDGKKYYRVPGSALYDNQVDAEIQISIIEYQLIVFERARRELMSAKSWGDVRLN